MFVHASGIQLPLMGYFIAGCSDDPSLGSG
jgi:hypothetical protein